MKKITIPLAALLIALMAAVGMSSWGMPGEATVPGAARTRSGIVAVAENRSYTSRIYTLKNEVISEIYRESRLSGESQSAIARVASDGEDVYFLRTLDNNSDWTLLQMENGAAEPMARGSFESEMTVTGLKAEGGLIWITGVMENGAVAVYEWAGGESAALKFITPVWWLRDVVEAEYDGSVIRAHTAYGDVCEMTASGEVTYLNEEFRTNPEVQGTGTGWLLCKSHVLMGAALVWLLAAITVLIAAGASRRAHRLADRVTAVGGEVLLLALAAGTAAVFLLVRQGAGLVSAVQTGKTAAAAAAGIWLLGLLLMRGVAGKVTAPIEALTRQMADVADGNVKPREMIPGKDELSRMNLAMQEMCMGLSIRDYEMNATIGSYKRFVPRKLTEMLDRAAVAEVDLGDSRRIVSSVGLFSVGNRDEVRSTLEDGAYVEFINNTFGVLHDCVQENNGSMITCGLRLACMETMFPQNPADGVRAGLDFLGRIGKKQEGGGPVPKALLILHKASFLFGVAGKQERLFPYLSSAELEFLESFAPRFHESGARMVMTEAYWSEIKNAGFNARYIGFVADGEKIAYKLYELLDVYPEMERKLRIEYDQRFQEAINLFYRNDFFLARNLFSTLLRVCPEDGIVRWYLFACEHFFNRSGDGAVDYRLFGIEEG